MRITKYAIGVVGETLSSPFSLCVKVMAEKGSITIVGLGPAEGAQMTRRAWDILTTASTVYLRTARHPAVDDLPPTVSWKSFDHIYDEAVAFEDVYRQISEQVIRLGKEPGGVVYAVPGHPYVGEATVTAIVAAARQEALPVTIVEGLSFIEPMLTVLELDALGGVQIFDAIAVASYLHPPLNSDVPLLLGQVYNRMLANEVKLALMAVYPDEHPVVLVHGAGSGQTLVEKLPLYEIDRSPHIDHLTSLYVPPLPLPASLEALAEAVAVLRSPEGCPWDQEQTPQSLRSGFLEEASEVLEALDKNDPISLQEELGDVLLHIVMQVQMAREDEEFRLSDVVAGIYAKIKRRHPHVWGDWQAEEAEQVVANWEAIKKAEKAANGQELGSLLDGIPATLPALAQSQKIQERVRKVGFDWISVEGVVAKLHEEIGELEEATTLSEQRAELGDILFALVNWGRWLDLDAESALREANLRFGQRFRLLERLAETRDIALEDAALELLEQMWQEAKQLLSKGSEEI